MEGDATITRTGAVVGTLAYMAPETAEGRRGDARADVFALGMTLFHAAAGRLPDRPSPHLPLPPSAYATMLGEKIARHHVQCWLVNTGWTGGPFGVGRRMRLGFTRAMVDAMLDGRLIGVPTHPDPVFGLQIPAHVPGVPEEVLDAKRTWSDPAAYDAQAAKLAGMFRDNFEKFRGDVTAEVAAAGPR